MDLSLLPDLAAYGWRVFPGLLLIAVTYALLPRRADAARAFLLILGFLLARDAMTPAGFWRLGVTPATVWLRFADSGLLLLVLGFASLLATLLILSVNRNGLNRHIRWFGEKPIRSVAIGILGALLVAGPFLLSYGFVPIGERGGSVPAHLLPVLLFFALAGNLLEEVLFRGYVQGMFESKAGPWLAALLSGMLFAAGHAFLSATVTDLGPFILVFTLYEGLVCAVVRMRNGVAASALTHGLAIFLLSAGLVQIPMPPAA